jgi:hypothetical protein
MTEDSWREEAPRHHLPWQADPKMVTRYRIFLEGRNRVRVFTTSHGGLKELARDITGPSQIMF